MEKGEGICILKNVLDQACCLTCCLVRSWSLYRFLQNQCLLRHNFESGMTGLEALTSASAGSRIIAALLARASVFWIPICCQDRAEPSVWMSIVDILEVTAESGSIILSSETNSDLHVTDFQTVWLQCFMHVHQASSYFSKPWLDFLWELALPTYGQKYFTNFKTE